jgi:hypothetical protein
MFVVSKELARIRNDQIVFDLMNCNYFGFRSRCQARTRSWNVGFEVLKAIVMKSSVLCNITQYRPQKMYRHFGGTCRLRLQLAICFMLVSCLAIIRHWRWKRHVPPKNRLIFNGLHGIISQKIKLFRKFKCTPYRCCRSQWPRGLRHEMSSPARTLGSWVRIPLKTWMFVCLCSVFVCR